MAARKIVSNAPGIRSIADALMSPEPGVLPFAIHQRRVTGGFTATNDQLFAAAKKAGVKNYFVEMDMDAMKASCAFLKTLKA